MTIGIEQQFAEAVEAARRGDTAAAEAGFRAITTTHPGFVPAHHMLARTLEQRGQAEGAIESMGRAATLEPTRPDHRFHLARLHIARGHTAEALEAAEGLYALVPNHPRSITILVNTLVTHGVKTLDDGALERAMTVCDAAAGTLGEDGASLLRVPVLAAMQRGPEARAMLAEHLSLPPKPQAVMMTKAWYELASGGLGEKGLTDEQTIGPLLSPNGAQGDPGAYALALSAFSRMLRHLGLEEWADKIAREAIRIAPHEPTARLEAAMLTKREGDLEGARRALESIAADGELLSRASRSGGERTAKAALFHLGRLMDEQGEHERAFDTIASAMASLARDPDAQAFPLDEQRGVLSQYEQWIERADVGDWPVSFDEPAGRLPPVFFVGFPRSGTTLTEQILDAHPALVGTGERAVLTVVVGEAQADLGMPPDGPEALDTLTDERVVELRERFYEQAGRVVGAEAAQSRRIVDKLPLNIIRLGFVRRLFPEAKVIVALRDPRDVCISCLFQSFGLNKAMVHFMRLDTTAEMYARVMGLWLRYRQKLGLDWIEHSYEAMIADPEARVRRLLDFLGVEWDPGVMRFHERAREKVINTPSAEGVVKPMYATAKQRWRRYGDRLDPVLPTLEPFIREFGYAEEE